MELNILINSVVSLANRRRSVSSSLSFPTSIKSNQNQLSLASLREILILMAKSFLPKHSFASM